MLKLQFAYLLGDTSPGVVPRLLWRLAGEHLVFIVSSVAVEAGCVVHSNVLCANWGRLVVTTRRPSIVAPRYSRCRLAKNADALIQFGGKSRSSSCRLIPGCLHYRWRPCGPILRAEVATLKTASVIRTDTNLKIQPVKHCWRCSRLVIGRAAFNSSGGHRTLANPRTAR